MSLGSILSTAAPIAAGYFTGGTGTSLFGLGATGSAITAGALTGAGIAALSGGDILTSGVMGGLGGYGGGQMGVAFNPAAGVDASVKAGTTTAVTNEAMLSPYTNAASSQAAGTAGSNMGMFANPSAVSGGTSYAGLTGSTGELGANMNFGSQSVIPTGGTIPNPTTGFASRTPGIIDPKNPQLSGGYDPSTGVVGEVAYTTPGGYVDRSFSAGIERLGGGDSIMGYGKLGLAGLPVINAAFEPETFTYDQMREAEAYDPNETLNLDDPALDSGIEDVINEDSGLRLYAKEGGMIPTYAEGGTIESRAKEGMAGALARNKGIAYARPTTAPSSITAPSNNIKIAGAGNSTTNLTGGLGALNVNSGTVGQSANAIAAGAEAARLKAIEDAKPVYQGPFIGSQQGPTPGDIIFGGQQGLASSSRNYAPTPGDIIFGGQQGFAQGGMLEGPGDGMSDSLAAKIDGSQPAALSQGEFVVPADVVSHLGNGSSDAGSKRLYAMMDEVRQARTGTEKQGKEINPERYMPA